MALITILMRTFMMAEFEDLIIQNDTEEFLGQLRHVANMHLQAALKESDLAYELDHDLRFVEDYMADFIHHQTKEKGNSLAEAQRLLAIDEELRDLKHDTCLATKNLADQKAFRQALYMQHTNLGRMFSLKFRHQLADNKNSD